MHPFCREMLTRGFEILGRDTKASTTAHSSFVVEFFGDCDHHAAFGDIKINRLIESRTAVLKQHVLACNTEVGRAVLYIGRHVRSAYDNDAYTAVVSRQDELARTFRVFSRDDAGRLQLRH